LNPLENKKIQKYDTEDMFGKILEFPRQLEKGWETGKEHPVNLTVRDFKNVIFSGMGGSAITGDLTFLLLGKDMPWPFWVNRGYQIPGFANYETLLISSSYSGNTEETLSVLDQAISKKCTILCISSNGQLKEIAREKKYPLLSIPNGYPPRSALGYSLGILLSLFDSWGIGRISGKELDNAVSDLHVLVKSWCQYDQEDCLPLQIAREIKGKLPLINASVETCAGVGYRWKTQLNENSKTHAFFHPFSEMNHNEIVGWEILQGTEKFLPHLIMILLRLSEDLPRNKLRMEITKKLLSQNGIPIKEVVAEGSTFLSQILYLVFLGDLVSFYLAILYEVNPTSITQIDHLKQELSKH
jgi:glucose/mannose-6-phosphate isomerase